ncbi:MAG: hypothetical protein AAGM67_04895 [Bacteroidota bacterium]
MKKLSVFVACFSLLLIACEPEPIMEPDLLQNNDFEERQNDYPGWFINNLGGVVAISDQESRSGDQSMILRSEDTGDNLIFVGQFINDFEKGKQIKLSAYLKLEEIEGEGLSIVVRGDTDASGSPAEWFHTTEGKLDISGDHRWKEYTLTTDEVVPENINLLTVYVVLLPNSSGRAWVDDISLDYVE